MTDPTPDFRALLVELTELQGHVLVECTEEWADVMDRARAALAIATPNFCALCAALDLEAMKLYDKGYSPKPPPKPPTVMEILELSGEIEDAGLGQIDLVRAALERWGK